MKRYIVLFVLVCLGFLPILVHAQPAEPASSLVVNFSGGTNISNQVVRFDVDGNAVDAHDGGIYQFGDTYYMYGTSYNCGFGAYGWSYSAGNPSTPFCGFKVYSSIDLVRWVDRGFLFDASTPEWQSHCAVSEEYSNHASGCYRPRVIYNSSTGKYVLWVNTTGTVDTPRSYRVLISDSPTGPFVEHLPLPALALNGNPSTGPFQNGDENLFVDDDGTGYIVYTSIGGGWSSTSHQLAVEKLTPDYTSGTGLYSMVGAVQSEAPTMFKRNDLYYIVYGYLCAYCPGSPTLYKTAASPLGPWSSAAIQISPNSCGGQPTNVAKIKIGSDLMHMFQSDLWNGHSNEGAANYFWTPLTFNSDNSIQPYSCIDSFGVALPSTAVTPPPNLDQSSGLDGFRNGCDIGGNTQRLQTFSPSRTGVLQTVSFTTYQMNDPVPNADLNIDLVTVDSQGQPAGSIGSYTIPRTSVGFSPGKVTVSPNVNVVQGSRYGIRVYSPTAPGCYGFVYNDSNPYPDGKALFSQDGGASFVVERGRALKFETTVAM